MSKKKCSKLDAIFEVGSENEFRQQVWDLSILPYRYTAILQSWKFQENLVRTVEVLPLLVDLTQVNLTIVNLTFGRLTTWVFYLTVANLILVHPSLVKLT